MRSLEFLYKNDSYLISHKPVGIDDNTNGHHVCERAIMFRFAHYMQMLMYMDPFFSDYSLDCEYNRNMDGVKSIPIAKNGAYPDIVIHKRGSNKNNYAVIEIKTYWNTNQNLDWERIREFMDPKGTYRYRHGVLVLWAEHIRRLLLNRYTQWNQFLEKQMKMSEKLVEDSDEAIIFRN